MESWQSSVYDESIRAMNQLGGHLLDTYYIIEIDVPGSQQSPHIALWSFPLLHLYSTGQEEASETPPNSLANTLNQE